MSCQIPLVNVMRILLPGIFRKVLLVHVTFSVAWMPSGSDLTVETQHELLMNLADHLKANFDINVKAMSFDAKLRNMVIKESKSVNMIFS